MHILPRLIPCLLLHLLVFLSTLQFSHDPISSLPTSSSEYSTVLPHTFNKSHYHPSSVHTKKLPYPSPWSLGFTYHLAVLHNRPELVTTSPWRPHRSLPFPASTIWSSAPPLHSSSSSPRKSSDTLPSLPCSLQSLSDCIVYTKWSPPVWSFCFPSFDLPSFESSYTLEPFQFFLDYPPQSGLTGSCPSHQICPSLPHHLCSLHQHAHWMLQSPRSHPWEFSLPLNLNGTKSSFSSISQTTCGA